MKTMVMKFTVGLGLICLTLCTLADSATINDVTVRQRWPWDRKVDINYLLTAEPGQKFDIAVTASNGGQVLTLPFDSLSGDLFSVEQGQRHIVWDPMVTSYTNEALTQFNVSLTPITPPLYMIIDLTKDPGEAGQITHVYEDDLISGVYGSVETNPIPGVTSIIWTGVTNDTQYMRSKLVLRRVKSGSFGMGSSASIPVTLTKGFYVGVFELTEAQRDYIEGTSIASGTLPEGGMSHEYIRGSNIGTNWPASHAVDPGSFIDTLRTKTGISGFDMPTEAQAEYYTRAGTTSYYYDGVSTVADYAIQDTLAWSGHNAGGTRHPVGLLRPNAWGLYDTLGNVGDRCLDWDGSLTGGTDPVGPAYDMDPGGTTHDRIYKGFHYTGNPIPSYQRNYYSSTSIIDKVGLRVVIWLP